MHNPVCFHVLDTTGLMTKIDLNRAGGVVQKRKELDTKAWWPDPDAHDPVEGENELPKVVFWPLHVGYNTHIQAHTLINNLFFKKIFVDT